MLSSNSYFFLSKLFIIFHEYRSNIKIAQFWTNQGRLRWSDQLIEIIQMDKVNSREDAIAQ